MLERATGVAGTWRYPAGPVLSTPAAAAADPSAGQGRWRAIDIGRAVIVVVAAAVVIELLRVHGGVAGTELASSWQLLDLEILSSDPLRGIWYLHTQPPLHNVVIGLVAWSPMPLAGTMFVLYAGCLLLTAFALQDLLVRWTVPVSVATGVACLAIADPGLLSTIRIASYEVPLAAMLVGLVWVLDRYLEAPSARLLAAIVALGTALVLTRALFHPLWLAVVLAIMLLARRPSRRQVLLAIAVPTVLAGGIALKNWMLVDSASLSSWTGFNLQRGVLGPMPDDTVQAAIADGAVTDLAAMQPWLELTEYAPWLDGCRPAHGHPAVADPTKTVGALEVSNFNHECYVGLYDESQDNALTMIRREPGQYLADRVLALGISHAYVPLGHDTAAMSILGEPLPTTSWMDRLFELLVPRTTVDVDASGWNVPLYGDTVRFELAWPVVAATLLVAARAAVAAVRAWRHRHGPPARREIVWLVVGVTICFVVVGGDLIELGENARFRSMLDPLLLGFGAIAATSAVRRVRERVRA